MPRRERKDIAKMLADEAELAEKDRHKPVRYARVGRPPKPVAERGQVYSIRIPVERLGELRRIADARGEAPAVLARDWILQRLDSLAGAKVSRATVGDSGTGYRVGTAKRSSRPLKKTPKSTGRKPARRR